MGGCSQDRSSFAGEPIFDVPSADADVPETSICQRRCSLDFRAVLDCNDQVVERCSDALACGAGRCQDPCAAAAAEPSSLGCEFYVQAANLGAPVISPSCYAALLVNTSTQPVDVSVELDGQPRDLTHALFRSTQGTIELERLDGPLPPGESAILFLADNDPDKPLSLIQQQYYVGCPEGVVPAAYLDGNSHRTSVGTAFHVRTSAPVSMATVFPFGGAASFFTTSSLNFPVPSWGNENMIVNGWESQGEGADPAAQIFAAEDDTHVTIIPKRPIQDGEGVVGAPANAPVTYRLDKGQYLQLVQSEELTGSFVTSDKPTSVVGGHAVANVPSNSGAADILSQQLPAIKQWGNEYVGVGYAPRGLGETEWMIYRIVGARDGTLLDWDPAVPAGAPVELSAGESVTFYAGVGEAFVVRSQDTEHPFYLAAYMVGSSGEFNSGAVANGDPEFVNVVPAKQYLSAYSFYADPTYSETSLVVVRAKDHGEFKDVWLDCAGKLTGWKPVGTRGAYEWLRVSLSHDYGPGDAFDAGVCSYGLRRTWSDGPFTATIWGGSYCVSYAYPGAMALRTLADLPLVVPH